MNNRFIPVISVISAILLILLVLFGIILNIFYIFMHGTEVITVEKTWVKYKNDDAKYLVSSTNNQVFEISDSLYYWRFNSSNEYASINIGSTCIIETQGFRLPFLSKYKNIISKSCINESKVASQ